MTLSQRIACCSILEPHLPVVPQTTLPKSDVVDGRSPFSVPTSDADLQEDLDACRAACLRSAGHGHALPRRPPASIAGDWVKKVAEKVRSHFTDHSEKLTEALAESNEKAWKTIEIALGGQRFWDRFASAEDHALREQVKAFLDIRREGGRPRLPDRLPEGTAPGQGEGAPDGGRRVPPGEPRRGSRPLRPVR